MNASGVDQQEIFLAVDEGAAAEPALNPIDTLINQANELRSRDPGRALILAQKALRLAQGDEETPPNPASILDSYVALASVYGRLSDYGQALPYALEAMQLSEAQGNMAQQFQSLNLIGVLYLYMGLYPEGLPYLLQAQALAETIGDVTYITTIANNIGWLYLKLDQVEEARRCFEAKLPLVLAHHNLTRQADYHDNLCQIYQRLGQLAIADQHAQQSVTLYQQVKSVRGEAEAWTTWGQLHLQQGTYEQAIACLQNALNLFYQVDNPQGMATAQMTMGQVYEQQNQPVQALFHLHEALSTAEAINALPEQYQCHAALSRNYQTMGDFVSALHHYQQFHRIKEELFNEQTDRRLKSLEVIHRVEQSRQQAAALEREIEEREQYIADLDAFAQTVAHDLKSPLGVIAGYSELMLADYEVLDAAAMQSILQTIWKSSRKMARIVDDLLTLAQVQRQVITPEPLNMGTIWQDVVARLQQEIEDSQAVIHPPDTWPVALGHASWIEEVWANYLSNALKYGGQPPVIRVGATVVEEGRVCFWMQDNGAGLDAAAQAKLFQDFSRLNTQQSKGHGLGLSIVKRIVERLGGTVGVTSSPGAGSTFSFTLPQVSV